jgi:hypothetical protein
VIGRPVESSARAVPVALILASTWFLAGPAHASGFVGPASCRVCHQAAYDQWRASPHARALDVLSQKDQKDTRCLQCHARDVAQGGEPGVTCETCHGGGQFYWPAYVMRDAEVARATGLVAAPDAKACALCHDSSEASLRPFDPTAAMQAIDHWSKDRAARTKSTQRCPRHGSGRAAELSLPSARFLGRALASTRRDTSSHPAAGRRALTARAD